MRLTATYVFYADVYFIQNLLLKMTVLYLALYVNKQNFRINPIKIIVASVFGTLLEILGLMWGQNFSFFIGVVNLVEIPLIMLFLLGREWKTWINVTVSAWFFVLIVNGVVEAVFNLWGDVGHFVEMVILSCLIVGVGTKKFLQYRQIQKGIYPAVLFHKGKKIFCRGFYDSGNCLKNPYNGTGVHIISPQIGRKLNIETEKGVLIPYSSLGNEHALMKAYHLEKIIIYGRKEVIEQTKITVGLGDEGLFAEKKYDLILNENVW